MIPVGRLFIPAERAFGGVEVGREYSVVLHLANVVNVRAETVAVLYPQVTAFPQVRNAGSSFLIRFPQKEVELIEFATQEILGNQFGFVVRDNCRTYRAGQGVANDFIILFTAE